MSDFKHKWVPFISGAAAGIADTALNYYPYGLHYRLQQGQKINFLVPFDYDPLKFHLTVNENVRGANSLTGVFEPFVAKPHPIRYWLPPECFRGIQAYSAIIPITCLCDGLTQWFKKQGVRPDMAPIASGMIAALIVSAPIGNMINVDINLKDKGHLAGPKNTYNHIMKNYGWKGFYTGLVPLICREGVYSWSVFYAMREGQETYGLNSIQSAVLSGTIATILSQPNDTMATYSQARRLSIKQTVQEMWTEGGIGRFYRGFGFRLYAVIAGIYVMDATSNYLKERLLD